MVWSPLRAARATLDLNDALYCLRFLLMILLLVEMMNQSLGTCPKFGVHFSLKSLSEREAGESKADVFDELVDVALGLAVGFMLEDASLVESEEKGILDGGYSSAQYSSVRASLVSRVELLPENEKLVVYYHYFQGLKFEEVASSIGLSKGRVSQLHKKALATLKLSLCPDVSLDGYL